MNDITSKFQAAHVTICSIYPLRLGPERRPYGVKRDSGSTLFSIPGVKRTDDPPYQLLRIYDSWQGQRDWMKLPNDPDAMIPSLIAADVIARDLVNNWTTGLLAASEGGHPGVGVIAGDVPTADELSELGRKQTSFFEALYYAGQKLSQDNNWKNITELHRQAALYLQKNSSDSPWVKPFNPDDLKSCPACQSRISALAFICPICRTTIARMPKELADLMEPAGVNVSKANSTTITPPSQSQRR